MVNRERVNAVAVLILRAAQNGDTVSFSSLYSLFDRSTPRSDMHRILEAACSQLAPWRDAIYSAVMARKHTGCPGSGFFDTYSIHRRDEYKRIAGGMIHVTELSVSQQQQITELERVRVYAHADKYAGFL